MDIPKKGRVLVLMGGESSEHDVSLRSGAFIMTHMAAAGFEPSPVIVSREGCFRFPGADGQASATQEVSLGEAVIRMQALVPVAAFIAMHGLYGEDGRIQALCDLMGIPYVGADVIGSAVAMDKVISKALYRAYGIPTPDWMALGPGDLDRGNWRAEVLERIGLPCVVKASRQGSSIGVFIVRQESVLEDAVKEAFALGNRVLIEAFAKGRELTVSVLEDPVTGRPEALPPIEIVVRGREFFDLESKYDPALADEICPAQIPRELAEETADLALRSHHALMLSGFSRTDIIATDTGPMVLETNTIPGMTEVSLFPKAAAAAGKSFPELMAVLIGRAIAEGRRG